MVIHFAASWDLSSQIATPKFVALALITPSVKFYKIDFDRCRDLAK